MNATENRHLNIYEYNRLLYPNDCSKILINIVGTILSNNKRVSHKYYLVLNTWCVSLSQSTATVCNNFQYVHIINS